MNSIQEELKHVWNRPNNGLMQLIIINVAVFVVLGVLAVLSKIFGFEPAFNAIYRQFIIPAPISVFITRPWTIITYAFAHSLTNFFHILFNMLWLYWFGRVFVEYLGSQKLINLYVLGALAGGITYLLAYNLIPFYANRAMLFNGMVGASAAIFAISVAIAVYLPDHQFFLLFIGPVKIKYLVAVFILISFLSSVGDNAGGNLAHLGGALMGYIYAKQWQHGREMGRWVFWSMEFVKSFFAPRPKIKVSHRKEKGRGSRHAQPKTKGDVSQHEIDAILDKISEKGYESLSKEEKEKLFNASK